MATGEPEDKTKDTTDLDWPQRHRGKGVTLNKKKPTGSKTYKEHTAVKKSRPTNARVGGKDSVGAKKRMYQKKKQIK